ncbi:MAG TPA: hypothetical protein DCP92_24720 [Nitrospiraceae bacterium]|nr:hypothetical protein [Nitrospiraceae bacterium]
MKITRIDAHDRFEHFTKQNFDISACCQDLIDKRPFGDIPFYIFAHARTIGMDEKIKLYAQRKFKSLEEVPEKTIIWQPRLTKPEAQENSMLFKAYPGKDTVKVIWMLPDRRLWDSYAKGKMTENKTISDSIYDFQNNKQKLEAKEEDDLCDEKIKKIYKEIMQNLQKRQKSEPINRQTMV